MTTAQVTSSTIESNAYNNLFYYMNLRTNIADPKGGNIKRTFIYDSDPFHKSISFAGMPYIVLNLPRLAYSRESANGKVKHIRWVHEIIVRTARFGSSGGSVDIGRSDMQSICDDLNEMFNSNTVRQQFKNLNMEKMKLEKLETDTLSIDEKAIYESRYELSYEVRLTTSS